MDRATYDRMAEIDRDHWWFVARRKIIARLIETYRPRPGPLKILEVGAGTGSNLELLQGFGSVDAIEPDDDARAFAEARSGLSIKGGYLPDVPLDDGAYDLIVLLDVLEHIPRDVEALARVRLDAHRAAACPRPSSSPQPLTLARLHLAVHVNAPVVAAAGQERAELRVRPRDLPHGALVAAQRDGR